VLSLRGVHEELGGHRAPTMSFCFYRRLSAFNANIDKVVDYLEARMPDDITVVGRKPVITAECAPTKVDLTADSWIDAKTRGETLGGVAKVDTSAIESARSKYTAAKDKMDKAKNKANEEKRCGGVPGRSPQSAAKVLHQRREKREGGSTRCGK
jgi:hypothetical protein